LYILGISAFYHDSAAALLENGKIVGAAQEERFTRKKHDSAFPVNAVKYCLDAAGISIDEVDEVVFYDKPYIKFERLIETYLAEAPKGLPSFLKAMPVWLKEKLFLKTVIKKEIEALSKTKKQPKILFTEHHQSHAASCFFPSRFEDAAVLCLDGVGEWATTTAWHGKGNVLDPLWQINFPHSLGLLYSAFTYYTGFKVNSGEYKLMGLAPYGKPIYVDDIKKHLIDIKEDGTFRLNMEYFSFATGLKMTSKKFADLFGGPERTSESEITQKQMDLARSIQVVTEEVVLKLAKSIQEETGSKNLCLAGGVALNCVANGKILESKIFENIWVQPAAGDAGGALGAAYASWYQYHDNQRIPAASHDSMQGSYLGPNIDDSVAAEYLTKIGASFQRVSEVKMMDTVSQWLAEEKVIGWVQDRMEFGPRALGNRSIIGDPRSTKMQSIMNLKIKYRESFRPFAPAVLEEDVKMYFEIDDLSPYMLMVAPVNKQLVIPTSKENESLFGIESLKVPRSTIPAVTHVNYSARVQTVSTTTNPKFHKLISKFKEKTGCSVLVNTSFNVRGEPIVCDHVDAYRCFMRTEMDHLIIGNILLSKGDQKPLAIDSDWKREFELD
jgi:carbamoyltransferase